MKYSIQNVKYNLLYETKSGKFLEDKQVHVCPGVYRTLKCFDAGHNWDHITDNRKTCECEQVKVIVCRLGPRVTTAVRAQSKGPLW